MFFRRILERKDSTDNNNKKSNSNNNYKNNSNNNNASNGNGNSISNSKSANEYHVMEDNESVIYDIMNSRPTEGKDNNNNSNHNGNSNTNNNNNSNSNSNNNTFNNHSINTNDQLYKMQRAQGSATTFQRKFINTNEKQSQQISSSASGSGTTTPTPSPTGSVQLSPLWEHVLRTRRLPETICPDAVFAEFHERLQDPEWQVRQHALRVLVDVLVVMGADADKHMDQLTTQLVENLGHQAPTVRKGALDCLRVYLSETAMPETIMLHILDIGLNRHLNEETFGGRLTCGVMLSLPALLQSILHTTKRHFILRTTIDLLVQKMTQLMQQEITLKVLAKIRDLIGETEFEEYMTTNALHEFLHLCKVYGITKKVPGVQQGSGKTGAWRALQANQASNWRVPPAEFKPVECTEKGKVIMETEIKLNDETLTMRILEADTDLELDSPNEAPKSLEAEIVCRTLTNERDNDGILQVISDSDMDEPKTSTAANTAAAYNLLTPMTPTRSLKRVTFGGEIVKMRTPDSDASNTNMGADSINSELTLAGSDDQAVDITKRNEHELPAVSILSPLPDSRTTALTLDIPSDNTKPLPRPRTAQSPQRVKQADSQQQQQQQQQQQSNTSNPSNSPARSVFKRSDSLTSLSPRSSYNRSKSISPVDSIISPKAPHKEIEVLHNLQRDPSPMSARSMKRSNSQIEDDKSLAKDNQTKSITTTGGATAGAATTPTPTDDSTIKTWEDLDIVDYKTLLDLRSGDWRNRLQGIVQLELALRSSTTLAQVQPHLDSLLRTLLSSERNYEVAEEKRDLLINLISRLPLDNLEDRTPQILCGLCRQSNAGGNRVCKALMQRLPAGTIVAKLSSSEFLHAKSSKFREHALQMAIFALMTFPSTCFDTITCGSNAIYAALNRKRRVRQAALEMLAVLGEIATSNAILVLTEEIAEPLDEGSALLAAVRKRLSRKQLPQLTPEGAVIYALQPSGSRDGADIDWIAMGEGGSASPNALKRRKARCASKQRAAEQKDATEHNLNYHSDESLQRHSYQSPPETYEYGKNYNDDIHGFNYKHAFGNVQPYGMPVGKGQAFQHNYMDRRLVRKTCSDSSMDGRSSDSTNTGSSGSGSFIQLGRDGKDGINGRFTRQTSRFPTMNHIDLTKNFRIQRPPQYYPGMGAYSYLQQQQMNINAAYPKVNYNLNKQHRKKAQTQKNMGNMQVEKFKHEDPQKIHQHCDDSGDGLNSSYTICQDLEHGARKAQNQPHERFINMGIGQIQGSKPSYKEQQANTSQKDDSTKLNSKTVEFATHEGSPISTKSTAYSQKSTASAKSSNRSESVEADTPEKTTAVITIYDQSSNDATNATTNRSATKSSSENNNSAEVLDSATEARLLGVLVVDDLESEETAASVPLKRNESLSSLHSKSESIKTQLEDTPQTLSRAQSVKSLAIEEDIEDNNSFIVVEEELQQESNAEPINSSTSTLQKSDAETDVRASSRISSVVASHGSNEAFTHTRSNSLESLYERPGSKQGSLDTTTTDYSSQTSSQLTQSLALPVKSTTAPSATTSTTTLQHTPLKEKSKTSYFLRSRRRVSPVKQAIKMSQPELFPQNMTKFEKPREALLKAFDQLDSTDWEIIMTGLKSMVRLMRFHPEHLENQMHMVCIQLTRSVRNLRSQVARAACQASTELFALKSKYLETECDDLVCALLLRTADTNRFLRADATRALESMCDHLQPPKILNILTNKGVQHQNALVRTTTAKLLNRLVERLGCDRVFAMGRENRDKFFVAGANLLLEGSLETRNYAKSLFRALSEHGSYNRLLLEVIPPRIYRNIEKALKNITR